MALTRWNYFSFRCLVAQAFNLVIIFFTESGKRSRAAVRLRGREVGIPLAPASNRLPIRMAL